METQSQTVMKEKSNQAIKMTGSEAVVRSLLNEGTDLIFGYPGGAIMPVYDALYGFQKELHHVLVRHEQGAVHAAQGYARVTGKVGVAIVTSGPGATNAVTGIADAMIDSTPLVVISGQVGSSLLGTDAFQETDVVGITQPITKWNYQIKRPEDIPHAFARAFYIARSGRPGPVLLDITKDAQFATFDYLYEPVKYIRSYKPVPVLDPLQIEAAAQLINLAKKPLALVGQGVILGHAEKELMAFLEKTGIPAAWTLLGLSAMSSNHPLNIGMLGMHGNYGPNIKTNEADLIIAIGMRFDDRVTGDLKNYATNAKVIHLEIDDAEINKNVHADVPVLADVKESLPKLTEKVSKNSHQEWLNEFRACDRIEHDRIINRQLNPAEKGMTMGEVVNKVSAAVDDDAIVVTDVGQHQMMASRYFRFKQTRSNVTSGGLGTMGFGLPAAMGAKLGQPDRHVILFVGDGGFQMTIQELGTIFQTKIPVKIVLLNNNFLGMVRQWQELFFDSRYASTELINPDFQTIAKGYFIESRKVTERDDLNEAIQQMVEHDGPYLLEVVVEKEGNVFPMVPAGASVSDIRLE
ncbi:biosynthetic-type acetolactate synthase large subunit [Alkalitalea saponilacus]|uniref:Acetolactate synthase n=1 Tax=Alkalitalea saponilacus TaxID=889453 RepID=A0A1T5HT78_9BACT|nr:biosynthetic-type acetolactate synthase large subunit [Alkalitalea saponilacus]ASB48970.1 acetolactate synthase, large subunit, biosynthetic type [Alkalitalea saponilacus]SKC23883.1 acetolactate synthase, large subunit [Alkalitalea saponilacus]